MRVPFSPLPFLIFVVGVGLLLAFVQLGALTIAFDKLGLSAHSAMLLLFTSLFGSFVNLPLFSVRAEGPPGGTVPWLFRGMLPPPRRAFRGRTLVAVNVGGCLIPAVFSFYLLSHNPLPWGEVVLSVAAVALISRIVSRPIPGLGIAMPLFVAPLSAVLVSFMVHGGRSAPLAYIAGTLGVLIGADLLRLPDIRRLGAPYASIGGAGTFDGIFLTGIVAVLLA